MIHIHKYRYIGLVKGYHWLAGVGGGIRIETQIRAKECGKCGKIKEI